MTKQERLVLEELLSTPSPTGFEGPGQEKWVEYVGGFSDEVDNDAYGNCWATLKGKGRKPRTVMIEAHADEIGYIVKVIGDDGLLRIDRIGGSDAATARGRRLDIFGDKGTVRGIIGNTAIHIRPNLANEKSPKVEELYVDIGASSAKEVQAAGIRVGHPAVYCDGPETLGKHRMLGRALDNRMGGFIIAQVLKKLSKGARPSFTVQALNAVQEEIGSQGARMAAHRLQPDVAVVLDVTHATDTPGIDKAKYGDVKLGKGPSLTHGACNHPKVVDRLIKVADKGKIDVQHESIARFSGTDTDAIYLSQNGIPSALISLPMRYMHSVVEMVDLRDVDDVVNLLVGFIRSLKPSDDFFHRYTGK